MKAMFNRLRHERSPIKFLAGKIITRAGLGSRVAFKTNGFSLRLHPTSLTEDLWCDPTRRGWHTQFIRSILREGDVCVDVGSNVGTTVIPSSQAVGSMGRVIAFEPSERTRTFLEANLALNRCHNVTVHSAAVGEKRGKCSFTNFAEDDRNQISQNGGGEVAMACLDDFTADIPHVALLKIDVEGYEKFVLQGAANTLAKTECLHIEFSKGVEQFGCTLEEIAELLKANGLALFLPAPREMRPLIALPALEFYDVVGFNDRKGHAQKSADSWAKRMTEMFGEAH